MKRKLKAKLNPLSYKFRQVLKKKKNLGMVRSLI